MNFKLENGNEEKYEIISEREVLDIDATIVELSHKITKCKIVLFLCNDENKVFNIAFKTPVNNSKGTPHILEHSVLCGSKKYDVKDPFIELAKTSLNTFLNAMTFPDKTCYPVASSNLKDFENLMDVYLDAVFNPNIVKNDKIFKQEGWHYEIFKQNDNLKVNGVVLNEMRGVYSDPDSILESEILSNLYSGTNYQYEYGGEPKEILKLTYEEFLDFHKKYYSPSNAIVFFYGDMDMNKKLKYLDEEYLSKFSYIDVDNRFIENNRIKKLNEKISYYNYENEDSENKSYVALSFSFDNKKNNFDHIIMQILDYILFSSEGAVLKDKLQKLGLGESIDSHYETSLLHNSYSIISQNINAEKKDIFIKEIFSEIKNIINNGITTDKFKAAINNIYFNYAEGDFHNFPKGLYYILSSLDSYLYGEDINIFLEYKNSFDILMKEDLSNENNIFIKKLKEFFIDNEKVCINVLKPKKGLITENEENLKKLLLDRKNSLSNEDIDKLIKETEDLKKYQMFSDDEEKLKVIPRLKVSDIEKNKKFLNYSVENHILKTFENTNGIAYIGIKFPLENLTIEEIFSLSLLNIILSKVDLSSMSYQQLSDFIDLNTGGLNIKVDVYKEKAFLTLEIKTLVKDMDVAFDILYKILTESVFKDENRIKILLNEAKTDCESSIIQNGHKVALNRALSNYKLPYSIADKISNCGIGSFLFLKDISREYDYNKIKINRLIEKTYKKYTKTKNMFFTILIEEKNYNIYLESLKKFKDKFEKYVNGDKEKYDIENDFNELFNANTYIKNDLSEAFVISSDVNFVARGGEYYEDLYSPRLNVLRTVLNYEYLWTNIRVLGGAYGAFSTFSKFGVGGFATYRDPNLKKSDDVFKDIPRFIKMINMSYEKISGFVIGTMGSIDNPITIQEKHKRNIAAYFIGDTDDSINKERHEILDTRDIDIRNLFFLVEHIINYNDKVALVSNKFIKEAEEGYERVITLS